MRKRYFFTLAVVGAAALGCGRGESAEDRQIAQLREGLTHVQSDADHFEARLTSLEVQMAETDKPAPPARSVSAGDVKTPALRVVHLAPDGTEEMQAAGETASTLNGDDPDDTAPRPMIRISASTPVRGKRGAVGSSQQHIEETIPDDVPNGGASGPPIQAGAPKPSALDPEAKRSYDAALALVNGKQYAPALDAFAAFLVKWPDHPNADNATYWRGECYFAEGEFARAAEQFEGVITRFPMGNKVPDALLKLGMSQDKLGNPQKAAQSFERLQRDFPRSEAARRIPNRAPPSGAPGEAPATRREVTR